jgi:hypothetical protein
LRQMATNHRSENRHQANRAKLDNRGRPMHAPQTNKLHDVAADAEQCDL